MNSESLEIQMPVVFSYVKKNFADEVDGSEKLFFGYVTKFIAKDELYEVMYEDGDWEQLTRVEVLEIVCSAKTVLPSKSNSCIVHYLRKFGMENKKLVLNGHFIRQLTLPLLENADKRGLIDCDLVFSLCNRFVKKTFKEGDFYGYVVSFDDPYYLIVYEDNDAEGLTQGDTLMIIYDSIVPQQKIAQIMKNALKEMEHPRTVNAIGKVTTIYGFEPYVTVIDEFDAEPSDVIAGNKRKTPPV